MRFFRNVKVFDDGGDGREVNSGSPRIPGGFSVPRRSETLGREFRSEPHANGQRWHGASTPRHASASGSALAKNMTRASTAAWRAPATVWWAL